MRRSALLDRAHGMCMSPGVASGARARARSIYARIYTLGLGGLNRSPEASEIREGDAALYSVTSHGTGPRRASFRRANERAVCASLSLRERGARRARTYSHLGCPPFFPSVVLKYVARVSLSVRPRASLAATLCAAVIRRVLCVVFRVSFRFRSETVTKLSCKFSSHTAIEACSAARCREMFGFCPRRRCLAVADRLPAFLLLRVLGLGAALIDAEH